LVSLLPLTLIDEKSLLLEDILVACGDRENEPAYRKIITKYPETLVRAAISETRAAHLEGRIKKSRGAYFNDTIKRLADYRAKASVATAD
jgi:hypothetical protein